MSTQDHSVSTAALNKSSSSDDRISSFIRDSQPATGIYEENPNGEAVQACFTRIIELCHEQLHPTLRSLIQGRWGLSEDIIDEAKLGYLPESYDLVDALQKDGFSLLTMYRTGVITDGILSHLYSCKPNECRHPFTGPIHELACQRHRGELEPEAIDLAAVIEYAVENDCHLPRTPWTNRIIFPYRGDDGHFHYLVARRTGRSRRDPKYMKLRKNRPWVNSQVIFEPLYGRGRVSEPDRLLVTEGITDVLAAQDHGYTCVAPVGTACSPRQFSQLLELVETADTTSLVFDTDENGTGQTKARELAEDLAANNYSTEVVRLPTIHSEESSTDLAEFLNAHSRADLDRILCSGNQRVTPESLQNTPDCSQSHDSSRGYSETSQPETPPTSRRSDVAAASGLFNLTLEDVISAEVGYRGDNPLGHVGESHSDYFAVFKATGERGNPTVKAYDHKANHGYNALTWLACEAGIRHTANPGGRFSNREIWATWRYAKQSGYLLEDDPIPARALWYIAAKHDLLPSKFIPSPSDDLELPASIYGRAIEIVQENYGIETGR